MYKILKQLIKKITENLLSNNLKTTSLLFTIIVIVYFCYMISPCLCLIKLYLDSLPKVRPMNLLESTLRSVDFFRLYYNIVAHWNWKKFRSIKVHDYKDMLWPGYKLFFWVTITCVTFNFFYQMQPLVLNKLLLFEKIYISEWNRLNALKDQLNLINTSDLCLDDNINKLVLTERQQLAEWLYIRYTCYKSWRKLKLYFGIYRNLTPIWLKHKYCTLLIWKTVFFTAIVINNFFIFMHYNYALDFFGLGYPLICKCPLLYFTPILFLYIYITTKYNLWLITTQLHNLEKSWEGFSTDSDKLEKFHNIINIEITICLHIINNRHWHYQLIYDWIQLHGIQGLSLLTRLEKFTINTYKDTEKKNINNYLKKIKQEQKIDEKKKLIKVIRVSDWKKQKMNKAELRFTKILNRLEELYFEEQKIADQKYNAILKVHKTFYASIFEKLRIEDRKWYNKSSNRYLERLEKNYKNYKIWLDHMYATEKIYWQAVSKQIDTNRSLYNKLESKKKELSRKININKHNIRIE